MSKGSETGLPSDELDQNEEMLHSRTLKARQWHVRLYGLWYGLLLLVVSLLAFFLGWKLSTTGTSNAHLDTAWRKFSLYIIPYIYDESSNTTVWASQMS